MAMRPRTFRRLVLSGVLLGVVVLGAVGYFVIAPMQERRTIEKLRADGMKAYESGDYAKATKDLRRYLRNTKPNPPEELLAFARAQARVESGDGGHLRVSIEAYRSYLIQRPDDIEVSQQLLRMFNRATWWPEAKNLATTLRSNPKSDKRLVLTEEITARKQIDRDDPELQGLFDQRLALGDLDFSFIWGYWHWLESTGRAPEAASYIQAQLEQNPDSAGLKVLRDLSGDAAYRAAAQSSNAQAVRLTEALLRDIGWNRLEQRWNPGAGIDSPDLAKVVGVALERLGSSRESVEVFASAAQSTGDRFVWAAAARRMYWAGQDERLLALDNNTATVLGYKALAARRMGQEQVVEDLMRQLEEIDTDFRAKAWVSYLQGQAALLAGREIEARGLVTEAIDIVERDAEPIFLQTMGEIYAALGFEEDAISSWSEADKEAGLGAWSSPKLSIINSLVRSGHYADAGKMATALMRIGNGSTQVRNTWLNTQMALAQNGMLDPEQVEDAIDLAKKFAENSVKAEQVQLNLIIAELHAIAGNIASAQDELSRLIASKPEPLVIDQILQITRRYDLGMIDQAAIDTREIAIENPNYAFGFALRKFNREHDRDSAMEVFELGQNRAPDSERLSWSVARAQFLDYIGDDGAQAAWDKLLKANPNDIKLLYSALDSNVKGTDRPFVESTIKQIMELTSSKGRAEPIRLRLARARAMVDGGVLTKSKRDEAMSIVRSVIATDPRHIQARMLLSRILEMPCAPQLTGKDRFQSDPEAAAAEKLTISRLIAGPKSRDYLLAVSKLNVTLGDNEAARQNLLEAYARSEGKPQVQFEIIKELRRAGQLDLAIPRLVQLTQEAIGTQKTEFELVLARMYSGKTERARLLDVLKSISGASELSSEQHSQLMNLYVQSGNPVEAEQVLANAAKYGLTPSEVLNAQISLAKIQKNDDQAVELLDSIVKADPSNADAWVQIARLTLKNGTQEQAINILEQALAANPENEIIEYNLSFMRNDPDKVARVVQSGDNYDEEEKLAMQQIAAYELALPTMDEAKKTIELERISKTFPDNPAVQGFVFDARIKYGTDFERIGSQAELASRRFGWDNNLLEIAVKAYALAEDWPEVIRTAAIWRGVTSDSVIDPDIYAARANYEMRSYQKSRELLAPYIESASTKLDEPLQRELLHLYAATLIKLREPGTRLAQEFEPIARSSEPFREQIWLVVARDILPDADEAVRWVQLVQDLSKPNSLGTVVDAWLGLSRRFPDRYEELTDRAITASELCLESYPDDPYALQLGGRALNAAAERPDLGSHDREQLLRRAMSLFDQSFAVYPADLNTIFQAAQIAKNLGDYPGAIARYKRILNDLEGEDIFSAASKNNLARVIELNTDDPEQLTQAAEYAQEAIDFQEQPEFLNTLGWIELKRGKPAESASLFQRAVAIKPDMIDAWAGLSVALKDADETGAQRAIRRLESLTGESGLDPLLEAQMERYGVFVQVDPEVP